MIAHGEDGVQATVWGHRDGVCRRLMQVGIQLVIGEIVVDDGEDIALHGTQCAVRVGLADEGLHRGPAVVQRDLRRATALERMAPSTVRRLSGSASSRGSSVWKTAPRNCFRIVSCVRRRLTDHDSCR